MAHHPLPNAEWTHLPLTSPPHHTTTCIATIACVFLASIWVIPSLRKMVARLTWVAQGSTAAIPGSTATVPSSSAPITSSTAATQEVESSKSWFSSNACKWLSVVAWTVIILGDLAFILYNIHRGDLEAFKQSTSGIVSMAVFLALVSTTLTAGIQSFIRHFQVQPVFISLLAFAVTVMFSIIIALVYQNVPETGTESTGRIEERLMALAHNGKLTSAYLQYSWNASWAYNVYGSNSCREPIDALCTCAR